MICFIMGLSKFGRWFYSPANPRHTQTLLLIVSSTWGLSYCVPQQLRIASAILFPPELEQWSFVSMSGWGAMLLGFAALAMVADVFRGRVWATGALFVSHTLLAGVYTALAVGAVYLGVLQSHGEVFGLLSAVVRPLLWGLMAWLHISYARLPLQSSSRRMFIPEGEE